ncbi:MAG: dTMP kinase [Euryarchaeota archaeon]|nr:dTMP kinase [Euryarchaeota archaeon]MDE1836367.1 dTMP kinase [Euryarchaeota archaeon]MDE1881806.1 dTMP kinase [Euryarchaeota archaeon]MDE2044237.1 dTMP kinase [Thermoplasmata archaeon]
MKGERQRGVLVAIEGIDGTGKSTLLNGLARVLRSRGWSVGRWKEPSNSVLGKAARGYGGKDPGQAALLFTLDRGGEWANLEALRRGHDVVLSDRSYFSTLAYQGSALKPRERRTLELLQRSVAHVPDLVLWLQLDARVALERVGQRGAARSRWERLEVLARTARAYGGYARREPRRFVRLDARLPPAEVRAAALAAVERRLGPRSKAGAARSRRATF